MLAAMVLTGSYHDTPWDEVIALTAFFFPEEGYDEYLIRTYSNDNISIGEIEMAEHDEVWR
ncbi:MAG: hypothetical protein LUC37_00555 [Prevotella sp.]|nr:hypothetical protein [Prevotella sp.]